MNLIFLGPPGAGKGTQADRVCAKYQIPKISTGDILRQARKDQTELGKEAESYMVAGKLVPDEVVIGIVNERLQQSDCDRGFILDGFPRTVAQADALGQQLQSRGKKIEAVISLEVTDESVIQRLSGRRVCQNCGATYHVDFSASSKGDQCEKCDGNLIQRKDDQENTIKERLQVYKDQTQPLVQYYLNQDILKAVNGAGELGEVNGRIAAVLENLE